MTKKILYIDMDGVIADFDKGMKLIAPDLELGDGPDYEERSRKVDRLVMQDELFFQKLEPIDHSTMYVKILMEHFDVYFLSTPMWNVHHSWTGKRQWIEREYGSSAEKRLILTHRKDLVIGDFLVDDRLKNGADKFKGEHILFGQEPFKNWSKVYNYLITKI